jgi:hypothetical protein
MTAAAPSGQFLAGTVLPAARTPATPSELDRLPLSWCVACDAAERTLRSSQASLLAELSGGNDFVGVAATGSGKSTAWLVPAAVVARAAMQSGDWSRGALRPLDALILVPLASQGSPIEEEADAFLWKACLDVMPANEHGRARLRAPRAVYVNRGANAPRPAARAPEVGVRPPLPLCQRGHPLLKSGADGSSRYGRARKCDGCQSRLPYGASRASCEACDYDLCMACYMPRRGAAATPTSLAATPQQLPCGECRACRDPTSSLAERTALGCVWACKVSRPLAPGMAAEERAALEAEWCRRCRGGQSFAKCLVRQALLKAAPTPEARRAGGASEAPPSGESLALEVVPSAREAGALSLDLSHLPHERAIAEDYSVSIVVATASALSADQGGPVLRSVLAARGVRRIFIDEAHTVDPTSMAQYNSSLASLHEVLQALFALLGASGFKRPQLIGLTSTLPPSIAGAVKRRLCMSVDAATVRCNVDRPELHFMRLPLPQRSGEPAWKWLEKVLRFVVGGAPRWVTGGAIVVFCSTARLARSAAQKVRVPGPGQSGWRPAVAYLGTRRMTGPQRAAAMAAFAGQKFAVLFTTEAYSHGTGRSGITFVLHAELPGSVVEFWQRSGRAARMGLEEALVVQVLGTRLLTQRAMLSPPLVGTGPSTLSGSQRLCRVLATTGCLRAHVLDKLGQSQSASTCGMCDACLLDGAQPPLTGGHTLGGLPYRCGWYDATDAAVAILSTRGLTLDRGGFGGVKLSELAASPHPDAPPPFNKLGAHDILLWFLIATGSLRYREVRSSRRVACPALRRPAQPACPPCAAPPAPNCRGSCLAGGRAQPAAVVLPHLLGDSRASAGVPSQRAASARAPVARRRRFHRQLERE